MSDLPIKFEGNSVVIGEGVDAIRLEGKNMTLSEVASHIRGHYPDMYPWDAPHKHPHDDFACFHGFDFIYPDDGVPVSLIPRSIRELKHAAASCVSVPAVFSEDVQDGDLVKPMTCDCGCVPEDLIKAIRGAIPDAVWVPAYRKTPVVKPISLADISDEMPFYGVAYRKLKRVFVGPIVTHHRFKFHTGDVVYCADNGDYTTEAAEDKALVGICLAPGTLYLNPIASVVDKLVKELKTQMENLSEDIVDKLEKEGFNANNLYVTVPGTTEKRTLGERFGDVVNVRDFGAVGDGTHNDTTAFKQALTYAKEKLGDKACLFIPVGKYFVEEDVNVPCYGPGSILLNGYTYAPFELLFAINGGIKKTSNGRYKIDLTGMSVDDLKALLKQFVQDHGGLEFDPDGKLYVDFSQMPTDKFEKLLKSIRVPIWLTKALDIYVDKTDGKGADASSEEGRGLSADKPFKTLQYAINFVADNYNLSNFDVKIHIAEGDYTGEHTYINLPSYNTVSGRIWVYGSSADSPSKVILPGIYCKAGGAEYIFHDVTLKYPNFESGTHGVVYLDASASVRLRNVVLDMKNITVGSGYLAGLYAARSGVINVDASSDMAEKLGLTFDCAGEVNTCFRATTGGLITIAADVTFKGTATIEDATCTTSTLGTFMFGKSSLPNPAKEPKFTTDSATFTGTRYKANTNSIISVGGKGGEFFPGSIDGSTSNGGQYA